MTTMPPARNGFTLTEMLIVITLLTTVVGALLVSLLVSQASYVSAEAYVQVQQEVRRAFDHMVKELREAGRVNNDVTIAEPGVQWLNFQLDRGFDAAACGGVCWGTDDPAFPIGWVHYVLDTTDPQHARLLRCVTANNAMPTDFAGCRVLANYVNPALADSAFTYDQPTRMVTLKLQAAINSQQLPGGSLSTVPAPLITRIKLRNS